MKCAKLWLGWLAAAVLGFGGVLPEARAETETVDGIAWTYTVSGGKASVGSGQWNGECAVPTTTTGTIAIPATLGGCPVTAIGRAAFHDCAGLTGVAIPDGVTDIGEDAFRDCAGLTSLAIGAGVTNVGNYAFAGCSNLVRATIADSVESIGRYAFYKCSGLRHLEVPAAWYGTGIVADAQWYPASVPVSYRGIDPLAVAVEGLPAAKEGEAYSTALEAAGGVGPCTWRAGAVRYEESSDDSTYAEITSPSAARQWYDAEFSWDVELPFEFPFFGGLYKKAKINSNGAISFGSLPFDWARYDEKTFLWTPFVAAMWESLSMQNGGVFMEEGSGWVKVQWRAAYEEGGAVNFSATLHEDGRIVFSYGAGNKIGGVIGLGAGDGKTVLLSKKSATGRMRNAQDIVFTPVRGMPEWLELTEDGMLRGTPEEGGNLPVTVFVEDAAGVVARKDLTLRVADAVAPTTQRVVFDANGGTCKKTSLTAVVGETYTKLASATWDGHSFLGWYDAREGGNRVRVGDVVSAQSHLNLWARWGRPRQTVHFNANGGTCAKTTVKFFVGDPYSGFAIPTWEGYSFLGWYDAQEGGNRVRVGDVVSDQAERTLWAHWGGLRQTVRFDANGGTCTKTSAKYFIGETYAGFKIPTREGFQFRGWYTAQDGGKRVRNGMTVTEDAERTLYAHWQTTAGSLSITAFSRSSCPVPTVRSTLPPATEYTLQLETTVGVTYEVQWVPALGVEWSVLNRWTADVDGENSISVSLPADSPSGFFRVVEVDAE